MLSEELKTLVACCERSTTTWLIPPWLLMFPTRSMPWEIQSRLPRNFQMRDQQQSRGATLCWKKTPGCILQSCWIKYSWNVHGFHFPTGYATRPQGEADAAQAIGWESPCLTGCGFEHLIFGCILDILGFEGIWLDCWMILVDFGYWHFDLICHLSLFIPWYVMICHISYVHNCTTSC